MVKAADITDDEFLEALASTRREWGVSLLWDVQDVLEGYPPKVVLAKAKSLERRKLIGGCTCGCRGDFKPLERA